MKKHIPNLFTLLNLIFGCFAIMMAFQYGLAVRYDDQFTGQFVDVPEKIWMASFFIMLAALVDFADGFVARLLKSCSPLGAQLDSLADVVSFGVAPSMILCQFLRLGLAAQSGAVDTSAWWLLPAFIPAAAAAYRLAVFNIDSGQQQDRFRGVPTPAAGLLTASLPLIYWNSTDAFTINLIKTPAFIIIYGLLISWLMVSRLPLLSLKVKKGSKDNTARIILVAAAILLSWPLGWLTVPAIFLLYIILSLFKKSKNP